MSDFPEPATRNLTDEQPSPDDGTTVCARCGNANPADAGKCSACRSFLRGNQEALRTGIYSRQPPPADPRMQVDALREGVIADRGGESELSTLEHSYIEKLGDIDVTIRLLTRDIATNGLLMRDKLKVQIAAAKVPRSAKSEEPVLRYLRHRDILNYVNAQPPTQHHVLVAQAEADGDDDFLEALATAPRYLRKVDPALVTAARERLAEAGNPEVGKLSTLLRAYDFLYNSAEQAVREAARAVGLVDLIPDAGPTPEAQKVHTLSGTPVPEVTTR